jgi:TonB family protein
VINAVPRTTLAQKRARVPVIREVEFAMEEIDVPKPEFGAVEIGPEQETRTGGTGQGTPSGKLPYRRPELMMLVPPVYPREAEKNGIEGTVGLRVLVTERGTVDKVEIEHSSGYPEMDEAAIKAARKTRFRPAIKDGERVAMWINYPIQFALSKRN